MKVESGHKEIWSIAWPIMLSSLGNTVINFTDVVFVSRIGEVQLAASALGGVFYFLLVMIGVAFGTGSQILIARREGEGRAQDAGRVFDHAFVVLAALGLLMAIFMSTGMSALLGILIDDPAVKTNALEYLSGRSLGILPMMLLVLVRSFYTGIASTRIITLTTAVMMVLNIGLNYILVFGAFGIEPMGIYGCGLASALSESVAALFGLSYTVFSVHRKTYNLFRFKVVSSVVYAQLVRLSMPVVLQHLLSMGAWFLFFVFIEKLGARELAISNVVRAVYMILMTPVWGFSQAANTMVSNIIGQGRSGEVLSLTFRIAKMAFLFCLLSISVSLVFSDQFLGLCTPDPVLAADAIPSFLVVCLATVFFGPAMVVLMAVSGTGLTAAAMRIEIASLLVYMVHLVVSVSTGSSLQVVWMAETVYWICMGVFGTLYLRSLKWKGKQL